MFIPNQTGQLSRQLSRNAYGEPVFLPSQPVACGVVRLVRLDQKTSVRSDSSASRGNANEYVADAVVLFPATVDPRIGDRFEFQGMTLRITTRHPRIAVSGKLDHYECGLEVWAT